MKIDVIVAEIGSTTTIVNAFCGMNSAKPYFLGQGCSKTTVINGDVNLGLNEAINDLKQKLQITTLEYKESFATSSAAGGLKMSVHGLVYDMTVRAAKEAALGAGANIQLITAGKLSANDLDQIIKLKPNIILLAGGVDYGEAETSLYNAQLLSSLKLNIPLIYAGNIVNQQLVKDYFAKNEQDAYLFIAPNVYPKIDELAVSEVRKIIQEIFEIHIIQAPGMHKVRELINQHIMPTPGAVMKATELLNKELGNLVTFDIGGATTDIHSVCHDNIINEKILINPEPFAKRTVEGDLGIYINKDSIINLYGKQKIAKKLQISENELTDIINDYQVIPPPQQIPLTELLANYALERALARHAGRLNETFSYSGKKKSGEGKDLSAVEYIIATGGALTRLDNKEMIIKTVLNKYEPNLLKPPLNAKILIDHDYIMASIGVLSLTYPREALQLLKNSLGLR